MTKHIAFAGAPLDLVENERSSSQLSAFSNAKTARALIMHHGQFLVQDKVLVTAAPTEIVGKHLYDPGPLFLGLDDTGPVFAFSFAKPEEAEQMRDGAALVPIRELAAYLSPLELGLAGRAKAIFDWHRTHKFCSNCGAGTAPQHGAIMRKCGSCELDHFPKIAPVVIMLVINGNEVLLGRGPQWPEGYFSALAGFISPGETLEQAVVREVREEVGLNVFNPEYQFSQPWPFPGQLMIGLHCQTKGRDIVLNPKEVSEAKWFSKETVRGVYAGTDQSFFCPPDYTIAHHLLKEWIDS